jgi:hypothetical protein
MCASEKKRERKTVSLSLELVTVGRCDLSRQSVRICVVLARDSVTEELRSAVPTIAPATGGL